MSAINITPAIANEEALLQVDSQSCGRAQKHAGLWLPAFARFALSGAGVKANFDGIEGRNGRAQLGVHRLDALAALRSPAHIRLISDNHEKKASRFQPGARLGRVRVKLEFIDVPRRKRTAVADHWPIEHAVPIQEDRPIYFVLSHFVCAVFSAGWETNKCQTTAWNASVCGVVFMGLTVGTITQTSATLAV